MPGRSAGHPRGPAIGNRDGRDKPGHDEQGVTAADRIALITGASRGIGRAVSPSTRRRASAASRARARRWKIDDPIKAEGGSATLIPLNLAHGPKIDALGPSLYERFGRLDILVGNAAMLGRLSPLAHVPSEHWERVLAVNLTANWRLIRTLDPLLRRSDAGRVIFVTSSGAHDGEAYWAPYSVSKAALEALAKTYASETAGRSDEGST